jgi:hypothetical protein
LPRNEELAVSLLGVLLVLGDQIVVLAKQYADGIKNIPNSTDPSTMTPEQKRAYEQAADAVLQGIKNSIPFWKIFLLIFIEACKCAFHSLPLSLCCC